MARIVLFLYGIERVVWTGSVGRFFQMIGKVAGSAWLGAQLLTLALFLPGGTLVVLALMLARRFSPATLGRPLVGLSFLGKDRRTPGGDLLAPALPWRLA